MAAYPHSAPAPAPVLAPDVPLDPLQFLGRLVLGANTPANMRSLPVHLAGTITSLAAYLGIRGEASLQHYYAEALTLTCLHPTSADVEAYEALLRYFIRFDRRRPETPPSVRPGTIGINDLAATHFVQSLSDQMAFQPLYDTARQLDRYGAIARPRRKVDRLILFARELAGQSLLAPPSPPEEMYMRLCGGA